MAAIWQAWQAKDPLSNYYRLPRFILQLGGFYLGFFSSLFPPPFPPSFFFSFFFFAFLYQTCLGWRLGPDSLIVLASHTKATTGDYHDGTLFANRTNENVRRSTGSPPQSSLGIFGSPV